MSDLEIVPEDWDRALAVVAHPDDMEYGASSAVAKWTAQGKQIGYVLATRGEAGISSMKPEEVSRLRSEEQRLACEVVGVDDLVFLDHPDGLVEPNHHLRRDFARQIRRFRPDAIISSNYRDSWGGPSWNHIDHRSVGIALMDAVRDAANPWVFTDLVDEGFEPWSGVRFVAYNASTEPTHAVDITGYVEAGVRSLLCHEVYLSNLDSDPDEIPGQFLREWAAGSGASIGAEAATTFELKTP
jgi:LmbE family N-acetylglucosaminyl deacetylase